jgi:uncharacterized RDD family membrane protein YckC
MNDKSLCQECGSALAPGDAQGLCPRCLMKHAFGTQPELGATAVEYETIPRSRPLPEPGEQFGRYRIIRPLGRGGMGVVYEAEEQDTGRRVALKVLGQQLDSPEHRARFLREGRLAASINHPNSVYVFGTEEIDGTPTIAMELVAGGTLQERVKKHGPMAPTAAVDAILQIIAGLEAAQAIGILHRDVKPGNCFENTDGTIKIGDFGLSISTTARAEMSVTSAGAMVGTPAFCSPEQLRGEDLNARSDMYSVGVTLFYLLTGQVPFEGNNIAQLTANVLEKRAPSPRQFRKEIPPGLANVVLRCLEKQSGERFKSYDELRQALAPYTSVAPTPATLGLRFLAGMLDMFFLGLIGWVAMLVWFGDPLLMMNPTSEHSPRMLPWMLGGVFVGMLYYAIPEGFWGATFGKRIFRLRVTGPDNHPPGLWRGLVRGFFYAVVPTLPFWIASGGDPYAFLRVSTPWQYAMQYSFYVLLALLFCTARRRNGFAAVYDLVTRTRVIARAALRARPALSLGEIPPAALEGKPQIGPYHILETIGQDGGEEWLLGYDLRLLRKVWIRTVPPGTPPVPASWRNMGRAGRLRWLGGRRSPEQNWDAFEGVTGQPLVKLARTPQSWSHVRYWVHDLASELSVAEMDGTLPSTLSLDRVWITGEGRTKLLDFPAPGITSEERSNVPAIPSDNASGGPPTLPAAGRTLSFLSKVAAAALAGDSFGGARPSRPQQPRFDRPPQESSEPGVHAYALRPGRPRSRPAGELVVRLPLHARDFLKSLPQFPNASSVVTALAPLLHRVAAVSQWRRAAVVAGCIVFPVIAAFGFMFGMSMLQKWNRQNPGLMELNTLLQQRSAMQRFGRQERQPSPQQYAVFIASRYRSIITNQAAWSGPLALTLIKGDARKFAEQSVAGHPAPTEQEVADAEAALKPYTSRNASTDFASQPLFPVLIAAAGLAIYVALPAVLAALLFRGGLVLLIANVTFVRRDGARASRLRVFWRAIVAWTPIILAAGLSVPGLLRLTGAPWYLPLAGTIVCGLVILSVALPRRGLPDRLAGTWPVPR